MPTAYFSWPRTDRPENKRMPLGVRSLRAHDPRHALKLVTDLPYPRVGGMELIALTTSGHASPMARHTWQRHCLSSPRPPTPDPANAAWVGDVAPHRLCLAQLRLARLGSVAVQSTCIDQSCECPHRMPFNGPMGCDTTACHNRFHAHVPLKLTLNSKHA